MKKTLAILALLVLAAGKGWAEPKQLCEPGKPIPIERCIDVVTSWNPKKVYDSRIYGVSTSTLKDESYVHFYSTSDYIVQLGTTSWYLEEFVKSGHWCEYRKKHEWIENKINWVGRVVDGTSIPDVSQSFNCRWCGKNRVKKNIKREVEEWEK